MKTLEQLIVGGEGIPASTAWCLNDLGEARVRYRAGNSEIRQGCHLWELTICWDNLKVEL